jgi:hypothetical protein
MIFIWLIPNLTKQEIYSYFYLLCRYLILLILLNLSLYFDLFNSEYLCHVSLSLLLTLFLHIEMAGESMISQNLLNYFLAALANMSLCHIIIFCDIFYNHLLLELFFI